MADWQFIVDDEDFPDPPLVESEPKRSSNRWWWVFLPIVILMAVLVVTYLNLQSLQHQGQVSIRDDLTNVMFEEETLRARQDREAAADLIHPNTQPAWRDGYWQVFDTRSAEADLVEIKTIDFDGTCAVVDVVIGRTLQVQSYCLRGGQWRRAAVPTAAWGAEQTELVFPNGARLRFFPRDQRFAEDLATDLVLFFETIETTLGPQASYENLQILIEPADLQGPIIAKYRDQQLVINSPLVVATDGRLSREATVRLALAKTLIPPLASPTLMPRRSPPGLNRFWEATHTVSAVHLLLPPEAQAALLVQWLDEVEAGWVSPFIIYPPDNPVPEATVAASAYLTADYIYKEFGLPTLFDVAERMIHVDAWDVVFQSTMGRTTIALDNEVALYFVRGPKVFSGIGRGEPVSLPTLPLLATFQQPLPSVFQAQRLLVTIEGQLEPVVVEIPNTVNITVGQEEPVPLACLPPNAKFEISGEWLEVHRRVKASAIRLTQSLQARDELTYLQGC